MRRRPVVLPVALAALSYVLALVQRPGEVVADTKVHLYLDPSRFLRDVLSLWSSSPDLGHVWASQYGGYAWPMAPWFALGDWAGLPVWVVHRLWLGTIFFVAAWGVVRLLDALLSRQRGVVHVVAAALYVVNPYVTVYADRASVTLLAYAALPWLLLATHRALREPRGWRWPIVFALVMATAGGGVNAATTAWMLVGPVLLALYEIFWCGVRWRGVVTPVLLRVVPLALLANLWWLIPLLLSGRGAPNFLVFTEQPGTIWSTTSLPESLRLMGFWTSYVGVGYGGLLRPYQGSAPAMLMLLPVVLAGLAWPAVALGTFTWTRRWRYAPFFLVLLLVGVLVMVAGWPEGTPLRRVITGAYYRVDSLQPLRTTYKAGALVALSLAVLCGAAASVAWARWPRLLVGGGVAVVAALAAWPLVTGRAIERQLEFDVPSAWHEAAADLSAEPDSTRAMILPGQLFASYEWGGTVDSVLPPLTDHPVTTRWIVPFADLRSTELQFTVDNLVTQERLRPGQLSPLLDLMGVGDVIVAGDGDRSRSGEMTAAAAKRELASQLPSTGGRAYSSTLRKVPVKTGGLVRVLPRDPLTVVDGAAGGLAALASYGALNPDQAYAYAPDTDVRADAARGAAFVISDTNRRRAFVAARLKGAVGPTLPRDEGVSVDGTILDPFGDLDQRVQTTAEIGGGIAKVTAPASPQVTQFPEQRPFAAVDGNPATAWIADRALVPARHTLTVEFSRPRDVETLRLLPYSDSRGVVKAVTVNGRRYAVRRGWNTLRVGLRGVSSVEVHLAKVTKPKVAHAGAGGIRELEIPDVQATETLRPPTDVEDALRGTDLSHNALTYMLDRTTTDVPEVQQKVVGERGAGAVRDAQDPEPALRRVIRPPAARTFAVDGWGSVSADLPDTVFARLDASPDDAAFTSSSRFEGLGRYRASGAFDGSGGRAWIGQWVAGHAAWIAWSTDRATSLRTFHLAPPSVRVRVPTRVQLTVDGVASEPLAVGRDGTVTVPTPLRGRVFRLDVLDARFRLGAAGQTKQRRAVGIGEITGTGIPSARVPRTGTVSLPCGIATATVGGATYRLRATADRAALDAGRPIRLTGCGTLDVPASDTTIIGSTSALRVDALRLDSTAPAPAKRAGGGGTVVDAGDDDHGGRTGVKLDVAGPSYLLLGQSYDKNWRATCDDHDLGTPQPLQGYANAWPVDKGCTEVTFSYAPQKLADIGYLISGVGCAVLLAALALFAVRRRRTAAREADALRPVAEPEGDPFAPAAPATSRAGTREAAGPGGASLPDPPPATPRAPLAALAVALPSAVLVAGVFGLRAGAVAAPLLALILWRGLSDRTLGLAVLGLLGVVVPAIYVGVATFGDHDVLGGNSTRFSADRLAAHWVAVAAFVLLVVVLVRTLAAARRRDRLPSAP